MVLRGFQVLHLPDGLNGLDLAKMISSTRVNVPSIIASGRHQLSADELPHDVVLIPKSHGLEVLAAKLKEMTGRDEMRMTA